MHLPLIGLDAKDIVRVGTLKKEVMKTMLHTQVQVDDQRLKRKGTDLLPEILRRMEEQKKRLELDGLVELAGAPHAGG